MQYDTIIVTQNHSSLAELFRLHLNGMRMRLTRQVEDGGSFNHARNLYFHVRNLESATERGKGKGPQHSFPPLHAN